MTYATQQLQVMQDDEVNAALATKQYKKDFTAKEIRKLIEVAAVPCDYCNNPSDIMPLAFERRIQIMPFEDNEKTEWIADQIFNDSSESAYSDTNPLRAIACLLLMIED